MSNIKTIWFYWDGPISETRLQILKDSVYSTRIYNPHHKICIVTNSLSKSGFEVKYNIDVINWNTSFFEDTPIPTEKVDKYIQAHPRDFSDLFRLILLYNFGGTYIDTDDLCIAPISDTPNIICRSYDPHTSFYNKIRDEECVPGWTREIKGYDEINMFPRNDCWQNWEPKHPFIKEMLLDDKFMGNEEVVWIGGEFSWQSITNETCIRWLDRLGKDWNYRLTLLYLFEDFVSHCSYWDRCIKGGEMCDIWNKLPNIKEYNWGEYKCSKEVAINFWNTITTTYPNLSHMWLHLKDMKQEWIEDIDETKLYSVSTWILNDIRNKIKEYTI